MKKENKFLDILLSYRVPLLLTLGLTIVASLFVFYNPTHILTNFVNSNYFISLVTGVAGITAFLVYFKQKADLKRDVAKTLLAEMLNSEKIIKKVKEIKLHSNNNTVNLGLDPMQYYLGIFSWNQYKYLFITDFDSYEWEKINIYFSQCNTFNDSVKDIANQLPKNIEYRTQFMQDKLAIIALEQAEELSKLPIPDPNDSDLVKKFKEEWDRVATRYTNKTDAFIKAYVESKDTHMIYIYTPVNSYVPIDRDLDKIDNDISKSSIGKKLSKLAR